METSRQQKIARVIQRDLAEILQQNLKDESIKGILISVTKVNISIDMAIAKVYLSIFPASESKKLMENIISSQSTIRHKLAQRTKNQLRKVPELNFSIDDSLEYMDKIEHSLKGVENPIKNPDLLAKRKKS